MEGSIPVGCNTSEKSRKVLVYLGERLRKTEYSILFETYGPALTTVQVNTPITISELIEAAKDVAMIATSALPIESLREIKNAIPGLRVIRPVYENQPGCCNNRTTYCVGWQQI